MGVRENTVWLVESHTDTVWLDARLVIIKVEDGEFDIGYATVYKRYHVVIIDTPNHKELKDGERFQTIYPEDFNSSQMKLTEITPVRTVKCFET